MSDSNHWSALAPLLTIGAAGLMTDTAQAEEPEPLDEEFLDYLLQLEGEEEDWTLFDSQEPEPAASKAAVSKPAPPTTAAPAPTPAKAPDKSTQVAAPTTQTEVKR